MLSCCRLLTAIETVSVYVSRQKEQFHFVGDNLLLYTRRLVATDMSKKGLTCSVHRLEGHLANERRTTSHNTTDTVTCETRKRCDVGHFNEVRLLWRSEFQQQLCLDYAKAEICVWCIDYSKKSLSIQTHWKVMTFLVILPTFEHFRLPISFQVYSLKTDDLFCSWLFPVHILYCENAENITCT